MDCGYRRTELQDIPIQHFPYTDNSVFPLPTIIMSPFPTTSTRTTYLPYDVQELVIDHVSDRNTLCSCLLVCKSWVPRAHLNLLSKITLSKDHHLNSVMTLLRTNPYMRNHVHSLSIGISNQTSTRSTLAEVAITTLLPLPRLVRIKMNGINADDIKNTESILHFRPITLFCFVAYTTLRDLRFKSVVFPSINDFIRIIASCPGLDQLHCRYVAFRRTDTQFPDRLKLMTKPRISSLQVRSS